MAKSQKQLIIETINKLNRKQREILQKKLREARSLHNSMKSSYYFNPPSYASGRRYYEEQNSLRTEFTFMKTKFIIEQETTCSKNNVYYDCEIYPKNGEVIPFTMNFGFINKIFNELENYKDCKQCSISKKRITYIREEKHGHYCDECINKDEDLVALKEAQDLIDIF